MRYGIKSEECYRKTTDASPVGSSPALRSANPTDLVMFFLVETSQCFTLEETAGSQWLRRRSNLRPLLLMRHEGSSLVPTSGVTCL